jgi:phosphopantothenoylcysteine synthetase/decarboxylase
MSNILICITAGISAYKVYDLINILKRDHNVKVFLSDNASKMVSTCTLSTLSKNKVETSDFTNDGVINHIYYPQEWADKVLFIPATANIIGKMANGIADDLISSTYLATQREKVYIAMAMNTIMYKNNSVQRNINTLIEDGINIINPVEGMLACGVKGIGKLEKISSIIERLEL